MELPSPTIKFNVTYWTEEIDSGTALIYRSQVTEDEDWYDILDWFRYDTSTLIALGDNFEKPIHEK